jgi:hypothetical protein
MCRYRFFPSDFGKAGFSESAFSIFRRAMAKFNRKGADGRLDYKAGRVAGGFGAIAARQDAEGLLRRAVMACLLWEDLAYESGAKGAENITTLVPHVGPNKVAEIAAEATRPSRGWT